MYQVSRIVAEYEALSPTLGDLQAAAIAIPCSRWKMRAKERYTGAFENIQTANPLLFVGNTFDPLTPLISAKNASAAFPGSRVLQSNSYGHTSLSQPSLCIAKWIRSYFTNGTLPSDGVICEPSVPTFASVNDSAIVYAPLEPGISAKRSSRDADDDEALLTAMKQIGHQIASRSRLLEHQ